MVIEMFAGWVYRKTLFYQRHAKNILRDNAMWPFLGKNVFLLWHIIYCKSTIISLISHVSVPLKALINELPGLNDLQTGVLAGAFEKQLAPAAG